MNTPPTSAIILAGGLARRMGGGDKALLPLCGQPLIAHVVTAIRPQCQQLLINTNTPIEDYQRFQLPLIADSLPNWPGPLAGLLAGMEQAEHEWIVALPCDTPWPPADLIVRLHQARNDRLLATVTDGCQLQSAFLLAHRSLAPQLREWLQLGHRALRHWLADTPHGVADFSDQPEAFHNANTPEELAELARHCR
jgi:molybdenum cofactor guanylyltransferase